MMKGTERLLRELYKGQGKNAPFRNRMETEFSSATRLDMKRASGKISLCFHGEKYSYFARRLKIRAFLEYQTFGLALRSD